MSREVVSRRRGFPQGDPRAVLHLTDAQPLINQHVEESSATVFNSNELLNCFPVMIFGEPGHAWYACPL
jgi:hypothetical protein